MINDSSATDYPTKAGENTAGEIAKDRADWLVDAVATATQNRMFLRGDPACDEVACEAILMNGEKAILVALERAKEVAWAESKDHIPEHCSMVAPAQEKPDDAMGG